MVRRGRSYGTSAQREGRSAGQRQARNIRKHNQKLREKNQTTIVAGSKPIRVHATGRGNSDTDAFGVYSVIKDGSEWVLRALSLSETREVVRTRNGWASGSGTEVQGRYLMPLTRDDALESGLELDRVSTKKAALSYVNAETSERVSPGTYMIRMSHLETNHKGRPRTCRETVDRDALGDFKRRAMRVYDD